MLDLFTAVLVVAVLATPLAVSITALLDAARRPAWVWALARRSQVVWIALIAFGMLVVPLGLAVSSWYLLRVRNDLAATESGRIKP